MAVRWGQELGEINLVFRPQATFSVSGVVADAEAGGPCRECIMRAASVDEPYGFMQRSFGVTADGGYRIRGLVPGSYRIFAEKMARPGRHNVTSRVVQVANRNLSDVNLVAGLEHRVSGRVVFESDPPPSTGRSSPIGLQFTSAEGMGPGGAARVNPDLTFETTGLSAATYPVRLWNLPPGGYLKAIRIGGQELPRREIEVPEQGDVTQLELVVGFDSATLSGRVKPPDDSAQGHRVTAALIALFPQESQSPFVVEQQTPTDASGGFSLSGIAPGAYTAFAFPQPGNLEWQDPDLRRRLQNYAKSVDLGPGKKETIELPLIPETAGEQ